MKRGPCQDGTQDYQYRACDRRVDAEEWGLGSIMVKPDRGCLLFINVLSVDGGGPSLVYVGFVLVSVAGSGSDCLQVLVRGEPGSVCPYPQVYPGELRNLAVFRTCELSYARTMLCPAGGWTGDGVTQTLFCGPKTGYSLTQHSPTCSPRALDPHCSSLPDLGTRLSPLPLDWPLPPMPWLAGTRLLHVSH